MAESTATTAPYTIGSCGSAARTTCFLQLDTWTNKSRNILNQSSAALRLGQEPCDGCLLYSRYYSHLPHRIWRDLKDRPRHIRMRPSCRWIQLHRTWASKP